jgi:hypothetical protein
MFISPKTKNRYCFDCSKYHRGLCENGAQHYSSMYNDVVKFGLVKYKIQTVAMPNGEMVDKVCFEKPGLDGDVVYFEKINVRENVFKNYKDESKRGLYKIKSNKKVDGVVVE